MKRARKGQINFSLRSTSSYHCNYFADAIKTYKEVLAAYPLQKAIGEMKNKELKEELEIRDLIISGNKTALQTRLRDFLQTPECLKHQNKQNHKAIIGFVREFQKKNKLNVPIPLQNMIYQYYPRMTL